MESALRQRVEALVRPLHQDLDGASRFEAVERIGAIALRLRDSSREPADELELLLLFHALGSWLEKVGNLSRASLTTGLTEAELRRIAASIRRLDAPTTGSERALAAAMAIDEAGVRGLAERLSRARREGRSIEEVARGGLESREVPSWMPLQAVVWLNERVAVRQDFCRRLLQEYDLADLGG